MPKTDDWACGAWGCVLPVGHNTGKADIPENHLIPEIVANSDDDIMGDALDAEYKHGYLAGQLAERERIALEMVSDQAVETFGVAWGAENTRSQGPPGARRRAGLRAVARRITQGAFDDPAHDPLCASNEVLLGHSGFCDCVRVAEIRYGIEQEHEKASMDDE